MDEPRVCHTEQSQKEKNKYHAIKRNEIESAVSRWMNLESVTQNKVRKRKTNTIYYVWTLEKWY